MEDNFLSPIDSICQNFYVEVLQFYEIKKCKQYENLTITAFRAQGFLDFFTSSLITNLKTVEKEKTKLDERILCEQSGDSNFCKNVQS